MKLILITTLQLLLTNLLFCQHSIDSQIVNVSPKEVPEVNNTITNVDTQFVPVTDSIVIIVNGKINQSKITFWEENFTTFLGSFLAAFVAILSIWLSNRVNRNNEKRKQLQEKEIDDLHYSSLLALIRNIAENHEKSSKTLDEELEVYKNNAINDGKLIGTSPFRKLETNLMREYLFQSIKYKDYDFDISSKVTTYIDMVELLERELNLNELKQWQFEDEDMFKAKIDSYFNYFLIKYRNLRKYRSTIMKEINIELKNRKEISEKKKNS